ncbi:hypothetical protein KIV45_07190 [Janthinobacterium lividum]|nr:hypothetical protein KIV45_07190 [Janthinobacterium lividum]
MTTHDTDHQDDHDQELNALLASLPQPAPSSALDAAILADAEKALHKPAAANDSADGVLRTLPAKKSPDYLQRWRVPLGLAAAVLLTVKPDRRRLVRLEASAISRGRGTCHAGGDAGCGASAASCRLHGTRGTRAGASTGASASASAARHGSSQASAAA